MNRRNFLKALTTTIVGSSIAPMETLSKFAKETSSLQWNGGDIIIEDYLKKIEEAKLGQTDLNLILKNDKGIKPPYNIQSIQNQSIQTKPQAIPQKKPLPILENEDNPPVGVSNNHNIAEKAQPIETPSENIAVHKSKEEILNEYIKKMRAFNKSHMDDLYLDGKEFQLLKSSAIKIMRLKKVVGHGNFYLLSFDEALKIARTYPSLKNFTKREINFLEKLFYMDASIFGFFDKKPLRSLTHRIKKRKVVKVSRTGNYLFKGLPVKMYKKIKKDAGRQAVLTSGVRSVMKQFQLYLNKAYQSNGNMSLASRFLAPPGYSYHGVSDFDIGQKGYGVHNFTERFTRTEVFKRLENLDYISLRYTEDNLLGVRFEPWHIKVDPRA